MLAPQTGSTQVKGITGTVDEAVKRQIDHSDSLNLPRTDLSHIQNGTLLFCEI